MHPDAIPKRQPARRRFVDPGLVFRLYADSRGKRSGVEGLAGLECKTKQPKEARNVVVVRSA
jgi:hypothetical protein